MAFVVDASVVLAILMPDETNDLAAAIFERTLIEPAQAPNLLLLEVANALGMSVKRKRITNPEATDILRVFRTLRIELDFTNVNRLEQTHTLGKQFSLTSYDASYLELAQRFSVPLATFDSKLAQAAKSLGILVL